VISDALKYVNGKAEKLSAAAAEVEKESVASYEEEGTKLLSNIVLFIVTN
jgi:hypothetical protein